MRGLLLIVLSLGALWLVMRYFKPDEIEAAPGRSLGFAQPPPDQVEGSDGIAGGGSAKNGFDAGEPGGVLAAAAPQGETEGYAERAETNAAEFHDPAEVLRGSAVDRGQPPMVQLDRGDRRTLGRILAQEREYKVLQAFLNGPAGSRMPQGTRDLATAFWIALTGPQQDAEKWAAKVRGAEGVSSEQELLLEEAIGAQPPSAIAASTQQRIEPLAYGMRMALLDRYAADKARQGQYRLAAESYSAVLRMEIAATWRANPEATQRWAKALNLAQAYHRFDPKGDWPSFEYEVRAGQNLILIRKDILQQRPLMKLCVGMLRLHNNIHGYIHEKQKLRVPTDMPKVIVDLDERIVLYMQGDEVVQAWNVGVGKAGQETPPGRYQVGIKLENPPHMPMGGPSLHFGHKDNPLGSRWIAWHQGGERTSFGFHGTNDESSVGQAVSKGCVRMLKVDVERLFELLPKGAEIIVQH